jgi:hypothetical protein
MTTRGDSDVPAASMTLGMVGLGALGGLGCVLAVTVFADLGKAVARSPVYLAWVTILFAEGVLAWSGALRILWSVRTIGPGVERTTLRQLASTLLAVALVLAANHLVLPRVYPLVGVHWPLCCHAFRMTLVNIIVFVPAVTALYAMWLSAARADQITQAFDPSVGKISDYLDLRGTMQGCLWFVGTVIGIAVLATGMLRQAMLAAGDLKREADLPPQLVLGYGAFFTVILGLAYVPAHIAMLRAGERIRRALLEPTTDVAVWREERKKLGALLGLDVSADKAFKDAVAILAPLVAGFVANALPGVAK